LVQVPEKVVKMAFGGKHSLFLTGILTFFLFFTGLESGKLWASGSNIDGQLGNPDTMQNSNVPVQVEIPEGVRFIKIVRNFREFSK
jgi:alpha-tubulin suppressor-like RCC1 family protein